MNPKQPPKMASKPSAPPDLSKEYHGVWLGWCLKGDREVAREAAAKGNHNDLVKAFLRQRRNTTLEEAETFYKAEVLIWVGELLVRKQIFKAKHILENLGLDYIPILTQVFYSTADSDLRAYIGEYLKKSEALDEKLASLWHLLDVILKYNMMLLNYKLEENTLECLEVQSDQWKCEIAAKLFLRTYDVALIQFLTGEEIWKQLLLYNDLKHLIAWITIQFNETEPNYEIPTELAMLFKRDKISDEMVEYVANNVVFPTKNVVLNELAKYGVFNTGDAGNFLQIIERLNQSNCIEKVYELVGKNTSVIGIEKFLSLLTDYCLENRLYDVLNICLRNFPIKSDEANLHLQLIASFRTLVQDFDMATLQKNILLVSKYYNGDLAQYFNDNPLLLLAIIFFSNSNFLSVRNEGLVDCDGKLIETQALKKLALVESLADKNCEQIKNKLTVYDLLKRHLKLCVEQLYKHQFGNGELPHFNSSELKALGYNKKYNYQFFLKQFRPCAATKCFFISQCRAHGTVNLAEKLSAAKQIYKMALKNFHCDELMASCVAFLEMIGLNSELLRMWIRVLNVLSEAGHINLQELYEKADTNPYEIREMIEAPIVKKLRGISDFNGTNFLAALDSYEVVMKFTRHYNLKPPELFLKFCASQNLWLPLLVFAQIHNYPKDVVLHALQSLKSPNLLEHISHSILHDIVPEGGKNFIMADTERNPRQHMLSRLGFFRQSSENVLSLAQSGGSSNESGESAESSSGSEGFFEDSLNEKATLLQTLIRCHNSADPPKALLDACVLYRNPLLAIFATIYEPDSQVTSWLTWLAVSTDQCQLFTNFETICISPQAVRSLLENCMKRGYPKTVYQSFQIFLPNNCLTKFLEFILECLSPKCNEESMINSLKAFGELKQLKGHSNNLNLDVADVEMTYFISMIWLEITALSMLAHALESNCKSLYEKMNIMLILSGLEFEKYINNICCPQFNVIYNIFKEIYNTNTIVNLYLPETFRQETIIRAVNDAVVQLIELEQFEAAIRITELIQMPLDCPVRAKLYFEFSRVGSDDKDFWVHCSDTFYRYNVSKPTGFHFFYEFLDTVTHPLSKFYVLKYACEWGLHYTSIFALERQKWLAYLKLEEKLRDPEELKPHNHKQLYSEAQIYMKSIETVKDVEKEQELEKLLSMSLSAGNFWLALGIEKMFGIRNADLDILKLMHKLAEGIVLPHQLNTDERKLLTGNGNYRRLSHRMTPRSARLSSFGSASHSPAPSLCVPTADTTVEDSTTPGQDTLSVIQALMDKLKNGLELGNHLFISYRFCVNADFPYSVIGLRPINDLSLLESALDSSYNKLDILHDFIIMEKWSKVEISSYLSNEIIKATTNYVNLKLDHLVFVDVNLETDMHLILQLIPDNASLVGYKLFCTASDFHKDGFKSIHDANISMLAISVFLLISAHHCFTADCNMEGIMNVLKHCERISAHLSCLLSWKLLVRLLTGIGRYGEMTYIFRKLYEHKQFEYLLTKGSNKDNALRVAIFEFMRKSCPTQRKLYELVALHFAMFSEVGDLWERDSVSVIDTLVQISQMEMAQQSGNDSTSDKDELVRVTNTEGTLVCLNKVLENYTHATEFHLKGDKLAKAMSTARKAELVAFQLSLLKDTPLKSTATCVLNLSKAQIHYLISKKLSFDQSVVLVEAYNYNTDWAQVLYDQSIINNNSTYLDDYLQHMSLTDSIAYDMSRKFLAANLDTRIQIAAMKNVLTKLPSIHIRYRLASELGFSDVVEDLLTGEQLAYLKDTVWKKGYKS